MFLIIKVDFVNEFTRLFHNFYFRSLGIDSSVKSLKGILYLALYNLFRNEQSGLFLQPLVLQSVILLALL